MQVTCKIQDSAFATFGGNVKIRTVNKSVLVLDIPIAMQARCAKYADKDRSAMYASLFDNLDR